jgi:hypothetical protein
MEEENTLENIILDTTACDNFAINAFLAGIHKISETTFKKMTDGIFNGLPPDFFVPLLVTRAQIEAANCSTDGILCNPGPKPATNADLTVGLGNLDPAAIEYSLQLIRGIYLLYDADKFEFTKGKNGSAIDVIFKASKGGKVVYYGDLTSTFPFHP